MVAHLARGCVLQCSERVCAAMQMSGAYHHQKALIMICTSPPHSKNTAQRSLKQHSKATTRQDHNHDAHTSLQQQYTHHTSTVLPAINTHPLWIHLPQHTVLYVTDTAQDALCTPADCQTVAVADLIERCDLSFDTKMDFECHESDGTLHSDCHALTSKTFASNHQSKTMQIYL